MPRKKMGLEQRLNFWVSQETYDFYATMADKRGEKVSELLRHVLDRAQGLFEKDGNFTSELPMTQQQLKKMVHESAREEVMKLFKSPTLTELLAAGVGQHPVEEIDPELLSNLEKQEETLQSLKDQLRSKSET